MRNPVEVAEYFLREYWNGNIPVNLAEIADLNKVKVKYQDISEEDISGMFYYDPETNQPTCIINSADSKARQRFTLAHELGHFALGHGNQTDYTQKLYRNHSTNYQPYLERQANSFAAELLMPEKVVEYLLMKENITDIYKLANIFAVSPVAMEYRLINLGWIDE